MAVYTLYGWKLSDFSGLISDPAHVTETMPDFAFDSSTTLDAGASELTVRVTDDDNLFEDAYVEEDDLSVLTDPITVDGVTLPAGSNIEAEYALITDTGVKFYIARVGDGESNSGENMFVFADAPLTPGDSFTFQKADGLEPGFDGPEVPYDVICFAQGTRIDTPLGAHAVETLMPGDLVETLENGPQPLRWIGCRVLGPATLLSHRHLAPIRFQKDALGPGRPARPLVVSPQHRMLLRSAQAELAFGSSEVLVPAKALINGRSIRPVVPAGGVTYYHFMCDRHEIVCANGVWSESLFPGPQALASLAPEQAREIKQLFPETFTRESGGTDPARPLVSPREYQSIAG